MSRIDKIRQQWPSERLMSLPGVTGSELSKRKDFSPSILIDMVVDADPTPQKKMVGWMLESWRRRTFQLEDIIGGLDSMVGETLQKFERYRANRVMKDLLPADAWSLMKYKGPGDLEEALAPCALLEEQLGDTPTRREEKRRISALCKRMVWHESYPGGLSAVIPFSKKASQFYGQKTRWCTAAQNQNMYERYFNDGPLAILTIPGGQRFQVWINLETLDVEVMDEMDRYLTQSQVDLLRPHSDAIADVFKLVIPEGTNLEQLVSEKILIARDNENFIEEVEHNPQQNNDVSMLTPPQNTMDIDLIDEKFNLRQTLGKDISLVSVDDKNYIGIRVPIDDLENIENIEIDELPRPRVISEATSCSRIHWYILVPEEGVDEKEFYSKLMENDRSWNHSTMAHNMRRALNKFPELLSSFLNDNFDPDSMIVRMLPNMSPHGHPMLFSKEAALEYMNYAQKVIAASPVGKYNSNTALKNILEVANNSDTSFEELQPFFEDIEIFEIYRKRIHGILTNSSKTPKERANEIIKQAEEIPEEARKRWHFNAHYNIHFVFSSILDKPDIKAVKEIVLKSPAVNPNYSFANLTLGDLENKTLMRSLSWSFGENLFSPDILKSFIGFTEVDKSSLNVEAFFDIDSPNYSTDRSLGNKRWMPQQYGEYKEIMETAKILEIASPATDEVLDLFKHGQIDEFLEAQRAIKTTEAQNIWSDPAVCAFAASRVVMRLAETIRALKWEKKLPSPTPRCEM